MELNKSVLRCLQLNGPCTIEEISLKTNWSVKSVSDELSRQHDSLAGDIIFKVCENGIDKYCMHEMAKQTPLELLNHFCSASYKFRQFNHVCGGTQFRKRLKKDVCTQVMM